MKKNDLKLIRKKTLPELVSLVKSKKEELTLSYAKLKAGKIKNTSLLKNLKKDIACLLTLIREKEIVEKLSENKK
jgi:ribosomal protein L29